MAFVLGLGVFFVWSFLQYSSRGGSFERGLILYIVNGINDREVIDRIQNPLPNIYICNEAYSDEQAWVEGALRSAEKILHTGFKITPSYTQPTPTKTRAG
jgi:hypothetical protein